MAQSLDEALEFGRRVEFDDDPPTRAAALQSNAGSEAAHQLLFDVRHMQIAARRSSSGWLRRSRIRASS